MILSIRTDQPEAEIGLFEDGQPMSVVRWQAHKALSKTIHGQIENLLKKTGLGWPDLTGIIGFAGPGSFTGLRIGLSVANTLASTLDIPIVSASGEQWIKDGQALLQKNRGQKMVLPNYGQPPKTTTPKG